MANEKTTFATMTAITSKTPIWAKWMFRSVFILTTVAAFIITSEPAISDETKVRVMIYLKGLDMAIYGFSKLFGVKQDKPDTDNIN